MQETPESPAGTPPATSSPTGGGDPPDADASSGERRETLGWLTRVGAFAGVGAAYGVLAAMMGRYLFPSGPPSTGWMYVARLAQIGMGRSLLFRTPSGATVNVARQGEGEAASDFIALSSTCPHLGCQVHWEPQNDRFFCPCHNGVFSPDGVGVSGPPGDAGQNLPRYPLDVKDGLLYIEVSFEEIAMGPGEVIENPEGPPGPGHDPCLYPCNCRPCGGASTVVARAGLETEGESDA
ncbi:MAG: Rieske (2Fe-2S) protein [Holophagales bacterium]|nr:Rieske (2Fe-2S) protein [Holophagales bacterium]